MFYNANTKIFKEVNEINPQILCVGHAKVGQEWCGKRISPDFSRLYYVIDGSFIIKLQDREVLSFSSGSWYLLPSNMDFDFMCPETMEHIYFHVKLCRGASDDLLSVCKEPLSISDSLHVDFIKDNINTESLATALELKSIALSTLVAILEKHGINLEAPSYSSCIKKALFYIRKNLSAKLTLSEISTNIFVSKSTLTKRFQKELGVSVNEYITRALMSEAVTLLSKKDLSVGNISERLGYSDQLYFSRRFKQIFGICPSEYKKNRCYLIG